MTNCNFKTEKLRINKEAGQAVLIAVILSLAISMLILFGLSLPVTDQIKNANDYLSSRQALINSETLTEEVLYRLNRSKTIPSVLGMSVLKDNTSVSVSAIDSSNTQTISSCQFSTFTRTTKAIMSSNRTISFNYGAWVGSGGIRMDNPSTVSGNVFSLGGGSIYNPTAISGVYSTSSYSVNFPVSDDDINNWKNQASSGQIINGGVSLNNKATTTIGALKIVGDLTIKNSGGIMTLNGPLYVTGNLTIEVGAGLVLPASYATKSETVVVGGTIKIRSGASVAGSGTNGSNILLTTLSTAGCADYNCTATSPAIEVSQSSSADTILIAPHGAIYLSQGSNTKGVLANYLYMSNSAGISYDPSLNSTNFNSSTSTFWSINSMREI
jgi:hypothetical protein